MRRTASRKPQHGKDIEPVGLSFENFNLGNLDFDIVSNFVLRISYFASLGIFTLVERALQINPFYAKRTQFPKKSNERK